MKYNKLLVWGLALILTSMTIGCSRNSDQSQSTTSIGGGNGDSTKPKKSNTAQSDYDIKHPRVAIDTSLGTLTLRLDAEHSQLTVDNFMSYVEAGLYDQTIFHQVYKDQAILAGGYSTNLTEIRGKPPARNEADKGLKNRRGTIAMLRQIDAIDSATSQFFINVADNPALDYRGRTAEEYGYCVFGEVVSGIDVVDKIANTQVQDTDKFDRTPVQAVVIKSIRRVK